MSKALSYNARAQCAQRVERVLQLRSDALKPDSPAVLNARRTARGSGIGAVESCGLREGSKNHLLLHLPRDGVGDLENSSWTM